MRPVPPRRYAKHTSLATVSAFPTSALALGVMDDITIWTCATGLERFLAASASPASVSRANATPDVWMRAVERFSRRLGT